MRALVSSLIIGLLTNSAAAAPGWRRASQQFETPKPVAPGSSCSFTFDSPKNGLAFTQTCTSPDRKTITRHSCRFTWQTATDLSALTPGQVLTLTGTVTHTGSTGQCAAYANLPASVSAFFISGVSRSSVTKTGKVTVPGPGKNPHTGKVNPLPLLLSVSGGNETRFLTLTIWYEWSGS
jgi:hypothetical protein